MPIPLVKICGLSTGPTLEAAIAARADYAGLVFFERSPRNVTLAQAADLAARGGSRIERVGLFVDATDDTIAPAVAAGRLGAIQLHGAESPERVAQVRARFALPVWKAVAIAGPDDVRRAHAYTGAADLVLFDAKTPGAALPGGMGLTFDWSLLAGWKGGAWGLAGGLSADNVAGAIAATGAPLVDTSSGVESEPGIKDEGRIAAFCRAAREG